MRVKRFWEIDLIRGLAIIAMIFYHTAWSLNFFEFIKINLKHAGWLVFQFSVGTTFILLVGISLTLSYSRIKNRDVNHVKKYFYRGIGIIGMAMVVTLATYLTFRESTVIFGVLHLIGVSIILAIPFLKLKKENLVLGLAAIVAGMILGSLTLNVPWLVWLGIPFHGFKTLDYYPILPWFGFVLLGLFLGNSRYPNGKRNFSLVEQPKWSKILCWFGRHSLKIYFVHGILLYGVLKIILLMI